jgi:hypothetical protein
MITEPSPAVKEPKLLESLDFPQLRRFRNSTPKDD